MRNAFGLSVPSRVSALTDPLTRAYLDHVIGRYLGCLGVAASKRRRIKHEIWGLALARLADFEFESKVHDLLVREVRDSDFRLALAERAVRVHNQVSPHLLKGATLDYGCGDGRVGELVAEQSGYAVTLADVYRHPRLTNDEREFFLLPMNRVPSLPTDGFRNVILCTVLHHADEPQGVLEAIKNALSNDGIALIIESVYDVFPTELLLTVPNNTTQLYLTLSAEQQLAANVFFDHFYNRCIHYSPDPVSKVNVPYNYKPRSDWPIFLSTLGFETVKIIDLGVDQPLCPLFHTLYVCRHEAA